LIANKNQISFHNLEYFMKKILLALAMTLGFSAAALATDLSSVGTNGVEATADYTYSRSLNTPAWSSTHEALAGLQLNLGGLGSFVGEVGDTQRVTDFRLNYTTFAVGYANGVHVGPLGLIGSAVYSDQTGDKWFLNGNNSSLPVNNVTVTGEAQLKVCRCAKLFADYSREYTWSGNINSFYNSAVVTSQYTKGAAVGTYVDITDKLVAKVGYTRSWPATTGVGQTQGVLVSAAYKF
jgi:hypothetical protein